MKRGAMFWLGFCSAFALLAVGFFLLGERHVEINPAEVLPRTTEENVRLIFIAEEGDIPVPLVELFQRIPWRLHFPAGRTFISPQEARVIGGLFLGSNQAALLSIAQPESHLYAAFELKDNEGKKDLPKTIQTLLPEANLNTIERGGLWSLEFENSDEPLWLRSHKGLLLLSSSREGLDLMIRAANDPGKRLELPWNNGSHVLLRDPGDLALILGSGEKSPLELRVDWQVKEEELRLAWHAQGLLRLFSPSDREILSPFRWEGRFYRPEPVILKLGLKLSRLPIKGGAIERLGELLDFSLDELESFLEGPCLVIIGGRAEVFRVPLTGVLVQLPGRGGVAARAVEAVWELLGPMGANRTSVEGFPVGGATSFPFTVVAAANDELAIFGVSHVGSLEEAEDLALEPGILWLEVDFPALAKTWSQAEELRDIVGTEIESGEFADLRQWMEKAGRLSLVLNSIEEGHLEWQISTGGNSDVR
jgi:hypothetical protein